MELPQIVQDDHAINSQLYELVQQRYSLVDAEKSRFSFQGVQLLMIRNVHIQPQLVEQLSKLLSVYLKSRVENGYCYYTVKSILQNESIDSQQKITQMQLEQSQIINKLGAFHKINHLITIREALLNKFDHKSQLSKEQVEYIDDIRFINEEIIKEIRNWKIGLERKGIRQPIIYVYKNSNYLTKIITDNQRILQLFNKKHQVFQPFPNPFFLINSQKLTGISVQNVNKALQILAQQRAIQLKMMIESPILKPQKNTQLQRELVELKHKIQDDKIKTVYKEKSDNLKESRLSRIVYKNDFKLQTAIEKNNASIKNLDQLIKMKEIEILKEMKKKREHRPQPSAEGPSPEKKNSLFGYKSKLQNLRAQIEKNVKLNTFKQKRKQKMPKVQAEVKQAKPKIKIIVERETKIQNNVNAILDMVLNSQKKSNPLNRSKSTFYKDVKIDKSIHQPNTKSKQDSQRQKNIMISSAYSYSSLPSQRGYKSTVNFKLRKTSASKQKARISKDDKQANSKSKSREENINQLNESLAMLSSKIREQNIKNIYSNTAGKKTLLMKGQTIKKIVPQENQKKKQDEQSQRSLLDANKTFAEVLKHKQDRIQELKQRLKSFKGNEKGQDLSNKNVAEIDQIQKRKQALKQVRQKLQLQNIKIKEQLQLQEAKFLELKQKEFQLKEEEIQNRYKNKLEKIKEEQQIQSKQFQLKIAQQHKKNLQNQQKLKEVTQKSQLIKNQLFEKQLKQKLYEQLFKQQITTQANAAKSQQEQQRNRKMIEQLTKKQEQFKSQLQLKAVQTFQQEKLKMQALHLELKRKNQQMSRFLQMKQLQIHKLEEQNKKEGQQIKQIQKEIIQKDQQKQITTYLNKPYVEKPKESLITSEYDMEEVKQKLKQELMKQIKKRQQLQLEEQARYQQERKKYLEELEEQMRLGLKMEDQQMHRIQEQYRIKSQELQKRHQQELMRELRQKQALQEQSKKKIIELQHKQPFQTQQLISIQTGLEAKPEDQKHVISSSKVQKAEELQPKIAKNQQPKLLSSQAQIQEKINNVQSKEQKKQEYKQGQNASPSKLVTSPSKATQAIKQNTQEIASRYNSLLTLIKSPVKQIFISTEQIQSYVNRFFSNLPVQVKEMIPFSASQMATFLKEKKVDIFDNYSLGWYKPKEKKYLLVGTYQSIPIIAAKYGEVQVQQLFIFNKNNSYQKQFLSKLIKIYQKVGYIYQKKTKEQSIFSIKFIVKIPKQNTPSQTNITDCLQIRTSIVFQEHKSHQQQLIKNNCIYYMLSQGLNQLLTQEEKISLAGKGDIESRYINKRINDNPIANGNLAKVEKVSDKIVEAEISLPLKYTQTESQAFFTLKASQYQITTQQQKLFFIAFSEQKIAIIIHKMQPSNIPQEFSLDNYIQTKLRKMDKQNDLQLFVPLWQSNANSKYKGSSPYSFTFKKQINPNLAFGSCVSSRVHKGNFLLIEPPFAFLVFQVSQDEVLRRILFGHIVKEQEIIKTKRVLTKA